MIQKSSVCLGDKIKNGLSVVCLLILGGCGGGVREDRTIENAETRKLAEERLAVNTDAQTLFTVKPIDDAIESWFHGVGVK